MVDFTDRRQGSVVYGSAWNRKQHTEQVPLDAVVVARQEANLAKWKELTALGDSEGWLEYEYDEYAGSSYRAGDVKRSRAVLVYDETEAELDARRATLKSLIDPII